MMDSCMLFHEREKSSYLLTFTYKNSHRSVIELHLIQEFCIMAHLHV